MEMAVEIADAREKPTFRGPSIVLRQAGVCSILDSSMPTLKLSTQHGYKTVLAKHLLPYWHEWRLRDIGGQDDAGPSARGCSGRGRKLSRRFRKVTADSHRSL